MSSKSLLARAGNAQFWKQVEHYQKQTHRPFLHLQHLGCSASYSKIQK